MIFCFADNHQITLPLVINGDYDFTVDWGDKSRNTIKTWDASEKTHTYASEGTYTVTITGKRIGWTFRNDLPFINTNIYGDNKKLLEIQHWDVMCLGNTKKQFWGASNLMVTAMDVPSLTGTTSMESMFYRATSLTTVPNMGTWNTSAVMDMSGMFLRATKFDQDLSGWDVSSVTSHISVFIGFAMASKTAKHPIWNS